MAERLSGQAATHKAGAVATEVPRAVQAPLRLMDPVRGLWTLPGRDGELTDLLACCEGHGNPALRLVTGPGETGKTRLALRLVG